MQAPSPSLHRDVVQQALIRARRRIGCFAAAFLSSGVRGASPSLYFDCAEGQDGAYAQKLIEKSSDSFFEMCRDTRDTIVRNRVRNQTNGPLLCRFLLVPVRETHGDLVGVFVLYNHANGVEFTTSDAEMADRLSRVFAKAIELPRDPLTKLFTHAAFARAVAEQRAALSEDTPAALLYGDIDQLHVVNDLFGMQAGDSTIALIGKEVLKVADAAGASASRLSGDRFTIFVPNCTLERAKELAENMRLAIAAIRFASNNQPIQISMSFGVAPFLASEPILDHGLAAAEFACKAAKDRGRNRVETYQDTDVSIIKRRDDMLIVGRLRTALDEGRFRVFAQPIARLIPGEHARRFEMLVRLIDEKDKLVMPQQFISSATRYQLLPQLDRRVIEHVLTKLSEAKTQPGFQPVTVSLNLSGPTISDEHFADWLVARIDECGIPGDWLAFELTENAAIANLERAQSLIERLGGLGCKFALDDFGTGVNSLAYLKALKLAMIKIDGSFIRDLLENERSESLVRGIAQLAHAMGIETVAEYVETPQLCMRLIELGVQFGQGYALGRPLPLERILDPATSLALAS